MAAGLMALGHHEIDAAGLVGLGVLDLAGQGADQDAAAVAFLENVRRRCAQGIDHDLEARIGEGYVEQLAAQVVGPTDLLAADAVGTAFRIRWQGGDAVALQHRLHPGFVTLRNHRLQVADLALLQLLGHDYVDAEGEVAEPFADPVEFPAQLLWREAGGAEHAQAPGLADRHHHVAAVAEGEDGQGDT